MTSWSLQPSKMGVGKGGLGGGQALESMNSSGEKSPLLTLEPAANEFLGPTACLCSLWDRVHFCRIKEVYPAVDSCRHQLRGFLVRVLLTKQHGSFTNATRRTVIIWKFAMTEIFDVNDGGNGVILFESG